MAVRDEIREQVSDLARRKGIGEVSDDEVLIPGVVDSLGIFRLVEFFENHFRIRVPEDEIIAENFQSISAMEQLVTAHLNSQEKRSA